MSDAQLNSYEDVPYASKPLYPTHPDCLATLGLLMGMQPAAVDRCRVLELGCASGGNLLPMAAALPQSHFVGIDLSPRQVAQGQAIVAAAGLTNIELMPLSIMDVDACFGRFDYIICHGVYSWVPAAVQDKILEICRENLAPAGIAYVSYNTFPGWHARGMVREMMGYHVRRFADPQTRVAQARAFLDFLVKATPEQDGAYAKALADEAELIRPEADYYLFHEHLEDVNQPVYFHEFAQRLAGKNLQYLGEATFHTSPAKFPAEVQEVLHGLSSDLVSLEQYVDFLANRTFRRTLICHGNVHLNRAPSTTLIASLEAGALLRPVSREPDLTPGVAETFSTDEGTTATTNMPLVKATLVELYAAWPKTLPFDQLYARACQRLANLAVAVEAGPRETLAEALLKFYLSNMVSLHVRPAQFALPSGERPAASPLVRYQASAGLPVANLRHRIVPLSASDRAVLGGLDGKRDRATILRDLASAVAAGTLVLDEGAHNGSSAEGATPPGGIPQAVPPAEWLKGCLDRLARSAILIA